MLKSKMVSQSSGELEGDDAEQDDLEEDWCPVLNSDAARMFEVCLSWLEHQPEASVQHINA